MISRFMITVMVVLSLSPAVFSSEPPSATADELHINLFTEGGLTLHCRDAEGTALVPPQPLLQWAGADDSPTARRDEQGNWRVALGPAGLEAMVVPLERGPSGEHRFKINLTNSGEEEIAGELLPPFTGWQKSEEALPAASPQHFLLQPPYAYIGTIGRQFAWRPSEFWHDTFVTVPVADGRQLWALLHAKGRYRTARITLSPGESITCRLFLGLLEGDRNVVLQEVYRRRGGYRVDPADYDFSQYRAPEFAWVNTLVAGWLNWAWDKEVMNPQTGEYRLIDSLREAERRFGGYDVYMFWPFWPRAGFDGRFQYDHYRNMPGGLVGLREQIEAARAMGVRTLLGSCIWSESDRDGSPQARTASYWELVEVASEVRADGVLMDVMSTTPDEIREMAREHGRDLLPYAEGDPNWHQSQSNLVGRIHNGSDMPHFNLKRYLLPHHPTLRVCEPGNRGKVLQRDLVLSFFSGHGIEINTMFPEHLPSADRDLPTLVRMLDILRANRANFTAIDWQPLIASRNPRVWINHWPAGNKELFTLCNTDPSGHQGPLLSLPASGRHYVDLWRYRPLQVERENGRDIIACDLDPYLPGRADGYGDYTAGCVAAFEPRLTVELEFEMLRIEVDRPGEKERIEIWLDTVTPDGPSQSVPAAETVAVDLYAAFGRQSNETIVVRLLDERDQLVDVAVIEEERARLFRIDKPRPTPPVDTSDPPAGMVRIPGGTFAYTVQHGQPTWQACYHLPSAYAAGPPSEPREVQLRPFWIDRYPVTNSQFAEFIQATGYAPEHPANFLAHFVNGSPPAGKEDHPVVFVSYDDAKAYAAWAGKRLPTEEEWQYAAGGGAGHAFPWGDAEPTAEYCNLDHGATTAVDAHPDGASPYGVEDLVGNVWQWTHSLMDNGRHWVVFLRGGGWYHPPEGHWWVRGGPRRIDDHHPLPLFGPAMNRLSSIGFRCVKDE